MTKEEIFAERTRRTKKKKCVNGPIDEFDKGRRRLRISDTLPLYSYNNNIATQAAQTEKYDNVEDSEETSESN